MQLEVNPDTVRFIVDRLRQFQVKEGVTVADPGDDWSRNILADSPDDPAVNEVRAAIDDLEPDQQVELVAILWVGRGDFGPDEWENAVAQARDAWNERTADYILGTPLAADFLEEGLDQLGFGE
ncbi:MAG: DUF3775 domain-containing protein [Gammaproteobacteria bacterium]